jgi:hypothetical protein
MPDYKEREGWEKRTAAAVFLLLKDWHSGIGLDGSGWDRADFIEDGVDLLAPQIQRPYARAGKTVADQFGLTLPPSFDKGRFAQAQAKQFIKELATNVAADLRGLGKKATAADLEQIFSRERASRAGVTFTTQAISLGEIDAAEFIEDTQKRKLQVVWRIDRSSNVCKLCRKLNGSPKRHWSRKFPLGPPAHPRCRCYLEFS